MTTSWVACHFRPKWSVLRVDVFAGWISYRHLTVRSPSVLMDVWPPDTKRSRGSEGTADATSTHRVGTVLGQSLCTVHLRAYGNGQRGTAAVQHATKYMINTLTRVVGPVSSAGSHVVPQYWLTTGVHFLNTMWARYSNEYWEQRSAFQYGRYSRHGPPLSWPSCPANSTTMLRS